MPACWLDEILPIIHRHYYIRQYIFPRFLKHGSMVRFMKLDFQVAVAGTVSVEYHFMKKTRYFLIEMSSSP